MKNQQCIFTKLNITILFLGLICLCGCASTRFSKVYVTNTKKVSLLPTQAFIQQAMEPAYVFQITYNDNSFTGLSMRTLSSLQMELYMLNEMGLDLGHLYYDGNDLEYNFSFFPDSLKPEYMILDVQNIFYDSESLYNHYKKQGIEFSEKMENDSVTRIISSKGSIIETITITADSIVLKNTLRGYEYLLTKIED